MMNYDTGVYEPEGYFLHLHKVEEATDIPECIVKAAKEVRSCGFMTTGDFFEKLDDVEVLLLAVMMDTIKFDDKQDYVLTTENAGLNLYHLSLLCFVLALGEGIVELDTDFVHGAMQALFTLIAVENMHRRGEVIVFRENYSVVESVRPIAKVVKGGPDGKIRK